MSSFFRLSAAIPARQALAGSVHSKSLIRFSSTTGYGKTFDKILIANRGEIACRVIRTAKKMGIKTVAIYSDADINSLHVRLADEAINVGPPATSKSYLNIPNIIGAIKQTGAQAVHPGYGFLSENSQFVHALDEIGAVFIGPNERAMAAMGDKIQSKIIAKEAKVTTIPGFNGVVENVDHAVKIANEIGYPVMIKASAGGGGKGMRIAWNDKEAREAFKISSSEALSSFGDSRLLVEKFIEDPRHIEIQLIGDQHGNTIYLPERECSIQRRNQKVIEEAPSVHIDIATRKAMGEQAVALAKNVGYYSAGTCEFLVDPKRNFYFLEMNTRLQVEHPITEYITGLDLVEQMIRVAAKQKLGILKFPFIMSHLCASSAHTAPLVKLARKEMQHALDTHPRFQSGKISTGFLAEEYPTGFKGHKLTPQSHRELLSVAGYIFARRDLRNRSWIDGGGSVSQGANKKSEWDLHISTGNGHYENVTVVKQGDTFVITAKGESVTVSANWALESPLINAKLVHDGADSSVVVQYLESLPLGFRLQHYGSKFDIQVRTKTQQDLSIHMKEREKLDLTRMILSPMPGSVVSISVKVDDVVSEGSELAVVEAMKMQNVIRAPRAGKIKKVNVQAGASVAGDEIMIEFYEDQVKK
ncbi:propionyl-CoA carboxylase alpha chain, mitochondrial [Batrachochytrium dendrobatidis JEL423]|uniref:Propionyl-CoA carboxylase alpha chain, mitochondrial n=1 Tax=Batrachochytrium dendrobatidis (strain JEL423) TaxID=403673 RepID=A0A177WSN6_BATDL|nr:propionyl-CoA carboxylase alpha chain, mitochondrial [Batrachochytrium dendrobatidis JEL423]